MKQTNKNTLGFCNIKSNLVTYNWILKKLIREAKFNYFNINFINTRMTLSKTFEDYLGNNYKN